MLSEKKRTRTSILIMAPELLFTTVPLERKRISAHTSLYFHLVHFCNMQIFCCGFPESESREIRGKDDSQNRMPPETPKRWFTAKSALGQQDEFLT